jgi:hypothetical protein
MFENLIEENIELYAIKAYSSPNCIASEFEEDMNRIQYIKRLITKYKSGGELKDRLIVNHLIIFYNVFGVESATRILFFKMDEEYYSTIKTFLLYLNFLPNIIRGINGKNINTKLIQIDQGVAKCLRELNKNQIT